MKFVCASLFLILIIFNGCQSPESSSGNSASEPLTGVQTSFADTPGLVKTVIGETGIGYYEDGKKSGSWVEYGQNNMINSVTTYLRGKKEGIAMEFSNNQLTRQYLNHNDLRHGEYVEYNNVRVKEVRQYVMGKLEGPVRIFYDTGGIMEEGTYSNGLRNGISKWYDQAGNVTIEYEYKAGELIKK